MSWWIQLVVLSVPVNRPTIKKVTKNWLSPWLPLKLLGITYVGKKININIYLYFMVQNCDMEKNTAGVSGFSQDHWSRDEDCLGHALRGQGLAKVVGEPLFGRMVHVERFTIMDIMGWWFQTFFFVHPYLGKVSNLTCIFQMGWNYWQDKVGPTIVINRVISPL